VRFEASQQMKLGQQMKLAPRMIQSMEILQMPILALAERIEQELESNIALETYEPGGDAEDIRREREEIERNSREGERELRVDEAGGADDFERLASYQQENPEAVENEFSASRTDSAASTYEPGTYSRARMDGERDAKMDAMANAPARTGSLTDQLLEQWAFADVPDDIRSAGKAIIENIDANGYLSAPLEMILESSARENGSITPERLEQALAAVQLDLDPPGVGARDVRECLTLQVDALRAAEPGEDWTLVSRIIEDHLEDLTHNRIPKIAQATGEPVERIREAIEHMRRLALHPGRLLVSESPPTIIPDAIVEFDDELDDYIVYLTDGRLPNLRLNREYARMSKDRSLAKNDRDFIKTNLSNAQWLIDALNQRRQTLLRVLKVVVAAQREVFEQGLEAVRPLPMTQVADQLGIHVATVSRAVAGKHLQSPRGVIPIRSLFTGGTQTESGEEVSWQAIKAALRDIVDTEDKARPLSDEAIVRALKGRGIEIARRTVAKYRGQLEIPPARLRKQF
jgi:RNA polymerase sigma-54 factor